MKILGALVLFFVLLRVLSLHWAMPPLLYFEMNWGVQRHPSGESTRWFYILWFYRRLRVELT